MLIFREMLFFRREMQQTILSCPKGSQAYLLRCPEIKLKALCPSSYITEKTEKTDNYLPKNKFRKMRKKSTGTS